MFCLISNWENFSCESSTVASQSLYHIIVYYVANYRPHLSHLGQDRNAMLIITIFY